MAATSTSARVRRIIPPVAVVLVVGLAVTGITTASAGPAAADPPVGGSTIVDETFQGAFAADPAWDALGDACLTGTAPGASPPAGAAQIPSCEFNDFGPVPPAGVLPGYLQLTDAISNATGSLLYNKPIPATAGVSVTFEQYQYGGNGADGIGFFLVDGSTNLTQPGGRGGSLGYAQLLSNPGVLGGYLGVGLDAYGNYYGDGEGRGTGCPADQKSPSTASGPLAPNVITVRGPGHDLAGYCWLDATIRKPIGNPNNPGTSLNGGTGTLRADTLAASKRTINVQITPVTAGNPVPRVIVQVRYTDAGPWVTELNIPAPANPPSTYKFGFSASTGGSRDVHLIRLAKVESIVPLASLQLEKQVDRTGAALPPVVTAGTVIPYQYTVTNTGAPVTGLFITDDRIATSAIVCDATSLTTAPNPGSSTVCRGRYTVTAADVTAGQVVNVAHAAAVPDTGGTVVSPDATVTVPLVSTISLTKSVTTPPPYAIGQKVSYGYTVTNTGGSVLNTVAVSDDRIPAGGITCQSGSLAPGASTTCAGSQTIQASQVNAAGFVVNTATVSAQTPVGQTVTAGPVQAQIPLATDVGVTKSVDNAAPLVGSDVTFTVTATGNGPATATGVVIRDLVPNGNPVSSIVFKSATTSQGTYDPATGNWNLGTLPQNASATLKIVATVNTGTPYTNSASRIATTQPDRDASNDTAAVTINPVLPSMDIAIAQSVDKASIPLQGTATFTISATNAGPQAATGVEVRDVLPPGLTFVPDAPGDPGDDGSYDPATGVWTIGALAVGETATRTITVTGAALGSYVNLAALSGTPAPPDSNASNNAATAELQVVRPTVDLTIVKAVFPQTVALGDQATYQLVAGNLGPDTAFDVAVTDIIPAGVTVLNATTATGSISADGRTWNIGTLASGQTGVLAQVTVRVDSLGTLSNTATIGSPSADDSDLSNNSSSAALTSNAPPVDIAVTKAVSVPSGAAPDAVPVGQQVTFTVTAENVPGSTGNTATNVVLADPLPAGLTFVSDSGDGTYDSSTGLWTLDSIPSGAKVAHAITATVSSPNTFVNTVSLVSLAEADTDPGNNSASVAVTGIEQANLAVVKSVTPVNPRPGGTATVTVTVTNNGPNDASGVTAFDPGTPAARIDSSEATVGTFDEATRVWDIGDLAVGKSAVLTLVITVLQPGWARNTVVVDAQQTDPDLSDNIAAAQLYAPSADVVVQKSVDRGSVLAGDKVTFTVGLWNYGPDQSGQIIVSDVLPAGLAFVSATASAGSYDPNDGRWTVPSLSPANLAGPQRPAPAPQQTLQIVAIPAAPGVYTNTASAARTDSDVFDPNHANNTDSVSVTATPQPAELHVVKTADPVSVAVGGTVTYTMTVSNAGPGDAQNVTLSDDFPPGVTPTSTETPGCTIGAALTCSLGTLAVGHTAVVTVSATVSAAGTHVNTVTVASTTPLLPASVLTADASVTGTIAPASGSGSGGSGLPATGGSGAGPTPLVAIALTMTGILLLLWSRRRRRGQAR